MFLFSSYPTQGMVQGKTYRLRLSGRYLRPEEREGREMAGDEDDEVKVSWEKMSKSKYNGVDPEVIINVGIVSFTCDLHSPSPLYFICLPWVLPFFPPSLLPFLHFSPPPPLSVCGVCVCVLKDVIGEYGADTVRVFMLFKAPPELDMQWDTQGPVP